ncbi:DUF3885 domain-containing protein [Metabacillus sp. HB246100]
MNLNKFMQKTYPNLKLKPPLFYNWDIGIRFELGVDWKNEYDYPNNSYVVGCYERAITLFEAIHSPTDQVLVVIDVNDHHNGKKIKRELKNFKPYVGKPLLYQVKYELIPYIFCEDDEKGFYKTHRFTLKCKTNEMKYKSMLKAICNHDIGLKPSLSHRVYFINLSKQTIFHVYDDRGCDLLATSPDAIRDLYEIHNEWILDYDKPKIDKVFD